MNEYELYHHGVLGMKWGIRRYQNPDGTLTKAGKRRAAKNYNYKDSDAYKNASRGQKATMTQVHNSAKYLFGKKAANKIDYKVNEEGADRTKETKKEFAKQALTGVAITALAYSGMRYVQKYGLNRAYIDVNNSVVDIVTKSNGLKEVKGGFTTGFDAVRRGEEFCRRLVR